MFTMIFILDFFTVFIHCIYDCFIYRLQLKCNVTLYVYADLCSLLAATIQNSVAIG